MIDPLYPIVDSMAVCATCAHELIHSVHMGPVRRDVTAQNCCLANYVCFFFFFKDNLAFRSRFCIKKCEREKRLCRYLEFLNHRIYGLCGIFRNKILDVFQSESD